MATNALSAIIFDLSVWYKRLFISKNKANNPAAIRLFPSEKEWFFTMKYKRFAAFSSAEGYKSIPSNV